MAEVLPGGAPGNDGSKVKWHLEYVSGSSGPMLLYIEYQAKGDAAYASPVIATDHTGTNLHWADVASVPGSFGNLDHAFDGVERWTAYGIIDGETAASVWFCTCEAGTGAWSFTRI